MEAGTTAKARREPGARTTFVRVLEEYWHRAAEAQDGRQGDPEAAAPAGQAWRSLSDLQLAAGRLLGTRSWPDSTGREVAEHIQAFVSGSGFRNPPSRPAAPTARDQVAIHNVFHIAVNTDGGDPSGRDLPDRLAEILREQAVQHGIDVT